MAKDDKHKAEQKEKEEEVKKELKEMSKKEKQHTRTYIWAGASYRRSSQENWLYNVHVCLGCSMYCRCTYITCTYIQVHV